MPKSSPIPPEPSLVERFAEALARRCGVGAGEKVLVAVSGGADSLALLGLIVDHRARHGWPDLHAAHLDHAVRGAAGRQAARAVDRLCRRLGLACTLGELSPWPAPPSEDDLRRARHAFLERVADEAGAGRIALAHHVRDQAETVLWNLARGSGRRGLGAMRWVHGRRIRPLLETDPEELRAWLRARRRRWIEDDTNRSPRFTRNRVRALIPLLERRVHPAARRNLARAAEILADEDDLLDELAGRRMRELGARAGGLVALEVRGLRQEHPALRRRILRVAVRDLTGGRVSLSRARTLRLEALLETERGRLDLGGGVRAERAGGVLVLRPGPKADGAGGRLDASARGSEV